MSGARDPSPPPGYGDRAGRADTGPPQSSASGCLLAVLLFGLAGAGIAAAGTAQVRDRISAAWHFAADLFQPATPAPPTNEAPVNEDLVNEDPVRERAPPAADEQRTPPVVEKSKAPRPQPPAPEPQVAVHETPPAGAFFAGARGARVRPEPSRRAGELFRTPANARLHVTGYADAEGHRWYRVTLANEVTGFVRDDVVVRKSAADPPASPADTSSARVAGAAGAIVRERATRTAASIVRLAPGTPLAITDSMEAEGHTWHHVVLPDGRAGYVRDDVVR